ncbi:MAG: hypothetical protein GJ680_02995 [Alteromonadaceae bacterium]|nr:hypothetical protein [Alteromonadaceae bacterium]
MFDKVKRFFSRKQPTATVAWERKDPNANKPALATTRKNVDPVATRTATQNAMSSPANNPAPAMRANHAASAANTNTPALKRSQLNHRQAERMDAKSFMNAVTAGGERNLMQGKARNENLRTKTKERHAESLTVRHRSGSVTELHMDANSSSVREAFHKSFTTGETTQLRNKDIRGAAKRDLNKFANKRDKRNHGANE